MSNEIESQGNDLLKEIAEDLKVNVEVLEERLEMVQVVPETCCIINGTNCSQK